MDNKVKVTGLLLGGYLLGRGKKLKLALTVASAVGGSALYRNREQIQETLTKLGESSPELQDLQEKITGRLGDAVQTALTSGLDQAGAKLQEQTDKINSSMDAAGEAADTAQDKVKDAAPADDGDTAEGAPEEESEPEGESEGSAEEESESEESAEEKPKESGRSRSKSTGGSRKTSAKSGSSSGSARKSSSPSSRKTSSSAKSQGAKK